MSNPLALIIEDDEDLAVIFREALVAAEYDTDVISDGQDALTRLAEVTPDLIVLDMHLPHVHGEDILRTIRADERLAHTRVVIATADAGIVYGSVGKLADTVLIKPIRFDQLRHLAERLRP
jgi:DNA-binding response OmpR family regulator